MNALNNPRFDMKSFKINEHSLDGSTASGNGHHGNCRHCGVALVTDLGYCSWDGLKCKDRDPQSISDFPKDIISYVRFRGYTFNKEKQIFTKPYVIFPSDDTYTILEMVEKVKRIKSKSAQKKIIAKKLVY